MSAYASAECCIVLYMSLCIYCYMCLSLSQNGHDPLTEDGQKSRKLSEVFSHSPLAMEVGVCIRSLSLTIVCAPPLSFTTCTDFSILFPPPLLPPLPLPPLPLCLLLTLLLTFSLILLFLPSTQVGGGDASFTYPTSHKQDTPSSPSSS